MQNDERTTGEQKSTQQTNAPAEQQQNQANMPYNPYQYYPYGYPGMYNPVVMKRKEQDEIEECASDLKAFKVVLLSWVFGILFSEIFFKGGFGLSVPLLMTVFYGVAVWYLSSKIPKPSKASYLLLIPIGLISLGYMITDNVITYLINTLVLLVLVPIQLTHMSNTSLGNVFSLKSFYSSVVSIIVRPVSFMDMPFKSVISLFSKGKKHTKTAMILLGIILALPITLIFLGLFMEADEVFGYYINQIIEYIKIYPVDIFFDVFVGAIVGLFISALLITLRARRVPEEKNIMIRQGLDPVLTSTIMVILDILFIVFVSFQFGYLFSGLSLPKGMNYSEYARSGFFELCAVSVLALAVIMVCMVFVKRRQDQELPRGLQLLLTVFIACNFIVAASAIFRMTAYILAHDLTVKRVMVTWLIILISICFYGFIIKIWNRKFNIVNYIAVTVISMTILLNTVNLNGLIAGYNVNVHLKSLEASKVREVDIDYLVSLGPSAARATAKLLESGYYTKEQVYDALSRQKRALDIKDWRNYCIWDSEAAAVFEKYGLDD